MFAASNFGANPNKFADAVKQTWHTFKRCIASSSTQYTTFRPVARGKNVVRYLCTRDAHGAWRFGSANHLSAHIICAVWPENFGNVFYRQLIPFYGVQSFSKREASWFWQCTMCCCLKCSIDDTPASSPDQCMCLSCHRVDGVRQELINASLRCDYWFRRYGWYAVV